MRVLLLGGSGQLGQCLQDRCPGDWILAAPASSELDICNRLAVEEYMEQMRPHLVINAVAYNFVDQAEVDSDRAMAVNARGPWHLSQATARIDARLIHISTDYVFDGKASEPYGEDAATNPINVYGKSKLLGEQAVLSPGGKSVRLEASSPDVASDSQLNAPLTAQSIVLRTAWLYSEYANNFVKTMLRLAAQGSPIRVVDDQFGTPTYAGDLANAIIQLSRLPSVPGGIYHYAGSEVMSWHGFAQRVFQTAGLLPDLKAVASSEYSSRALRPKYSALSSKKIAYYDIQAKRVQVGLDCVIDRL